MKYVEANVGDILTLVDSIMKTYLVVGKIVSPPVPYPDIRWVKLITLDSSGIVRDDLFESPIMWESSSRIIKILGHE